MQDNIFLEGSKCLLRPLEAKDLTAAYLQWLNDAEVNTHNSHAVFPHTWEKMQAYYNGLNSQQQVVLAIVDKQTRAHVGNVALQGINWVNRSAEFAILLGDKSVWGKGIGTEAARLIVDYGFQRLNLHRIHCGTLEGNDAMQKIAARLHMHQEGRRREAVYKNGKFYAIVEYGVLRHEYPL